ncbi:sporulation protein YtxC [Alicyclobacillus vulcanalis]|uniref:YtxC-like family protein n=1 Tax=Alicyclobacillus vulcanalis TaxID=252246 RepID=A0A1N7PCL9_9BACL|nr:sporulation protein YtxC [Alicyclobacillus vulcanalis]SIT08308.1 YtxC-like family protein [Alicyclobacillus vulcanalis]
MLIFELTAELDSLGLAGRLTECGAASYVVSGDRPRVVCECGPALYPRVAQLVAGTMTRDWLQARVVDRVNRMEPLWAAEEVQFHAIIELSETRLKNRPVAGHTLDEWQSMLARALASQFGRSVCVALDPFARFRLHRAVVELALRVRDRLAAALLEDEYEESLAMLRYMLDEQPACEAELHVYITPEGIWVTDAEGARVSDAQIERVALQDEDVTSEDLAMTLLITRSPWRIVVHDGYPDAPWPSFSETLSRVFGDRATLCTGCAACGTKAPAEAQRPREKSHREPTLRRRLALRERGPAEEGGLGEG